MDRQQAIDKLKEVRTDCDGDDALEDALDYVLNFLDRKPDLFLVQLVHNGEAYDHSWWVPRWGEPDPTPLHGTPVLVGPNNVEMGTHRVRPFWTYMGAVE